MCLLVALRTGACRSLVMNTVPLSNSLLNFFLRIGTVSFNFGNSLFDSTGPCLGIYRSNKPVIDTVGKAKSESG